MTPYFCNMCSRPIPRIEATKEYEMLGVILCSQECAEQATSGSESEADDWCSWIYSRVIPYEIYLMALLAE